MYCSRTGRAYDIVSNICSHIDNLRLLHDDCGILVLITLRILARCVPFVFSDITLGAIIVCERIVRRAMTPLITMYRWADNLPNILVKGIYHDLFS